MALADAVSATIHVAFAGLWTGTVLFVVFAVLPLATDGSLNAKPLAAFAGKLKTVSRVSTVLLLLTGGHLTGSLYTVASLTGTGAGHAVLAMIVLWLVLTVLVEIGAGKLTDGTETGKVRTPAAAAKPYLQGSALVAVLLLIDAGALAGGLV
ncbi:MAG: transporter [Haloarculaceae archaeon]